MKADIWRQMKAFQDDPSLSQLPFPPTLSSEDRKYVHKIALNLSFTTKSTGNRNDGSRHVIVYKAAGHKVGGRSHPHPLHSIPISLSHLFPACLSCPVPCQAAGPRPPSPSGHSRADRRLPAAAPVGGHPALRPPAYAQSPLCSLGLGSPAHCPPASPPVLSPLPPRLSVQPRYQAMQPVRGRLPITSQRSAILSLFPPPPSYRPQW